MVCRANCQGWRYWIYGVIFVYLLFLYSEDNENLRAATEGIRDIPGETISINIKKNSKMHGVTARSPGILQGPSLNRGNASDFDSSGPIMTTESESADPVRAANSPDSDPDLDSWINSQVDSLLDERELIYEERRTLTVSEIAALHSVKDNEGYPYALANEARLVLRELAIESRIPQNCAEEMTFECLDILERSQAGSIPFECQNQDDQKECENAFVRFWES